LNTLEGAPTKVRYSFNCNQNQLTSLVGAPREVHGDFKCSRNKLTSLEGITAFIGGNFTCEDNEGLAFTEEEVRAVCRVEGEVYVGESY